MKLSLRLIEEVNPDRLVPTCTTTISRGTNLTTLLPLRAMEGLDIALTMDNNMVHRLGLIHSFGIGFRM